MNMGDDEDIKTYAIFTALTAFSLSMLPSITVRTIIARKITAPTIYMFS